MLTIKVEKFKFQFLIRCNQTILFLSLILLYCSSSQVSKKINIDIETLRHIKTQKW